MGAIQLPCSSRSVVEIGRRSHAVSCRAVWCRAAWCRCGVVSLQCGAVWCRAVPCRSVPLWCGVAFLRCRVVVVEGGGQVSSDRSADQSEPPSLWSELE